MSQQKCLFPEWGDASLKPTHFSDLRRAQVLILAIGYIAQGTLSPRLHTAQKAHDKMLTGVMHSPLRFLKPHRQGE
ncbi:MAG: hypothetical protein IPG23_11720 [Burkholderiales bacterium]|nr:hypothetical protein [Burkholderiales bacterium]